MTTPTDPAVFMDAETLLARQMVNELSQQLDYRIGEILRWQKYYDGQQPLKFSTAEYRKHFGRQYAGFQDNWTAPIVDTTAEKLTVAGLRLADPSINLVDGTGSDIARTADRDFARIWSANECEAQSSQAFTEACIAKRAFALVWGDGDGTDTPDITFETADEVIVGYEPGARRRRKAALKRWTDGKNDYATLYTPDAIWKWQRERPAGSLKNYTPDELRKYQWIIRNMPTGQLARLPNPAGVVPIVELANRPRLKSEPLSEVAGAAAMQDAINALWAY
ncbi:MAG: phage portal protein, partial [Trebonia sp.]